MSYVVDVYKKEIKPESSFVKFALYISFFPQLIAGPIERAKDLLKELDKKNNFNYYNFSRGVKLILYGMFKKMVVADNLAKHVDLVFGNLNNYDSSYICIAIIFFSIQIYNDFSGYSDIAIGTARILGIKLNLNFNFPYFSKSFSEFWRRWHISLSNWFRDYLYIPLGGNRKSQFRVYINIIVVFLVSGLWHGANWTFIIWGGIHGLMLIIESIAKKIDFLAGVPKLIGSLFKRFYTIFFVIIAWVFFRADDILDAFYIFDKIFDSSFTDLFVNIYKSITNNAELLLSFIIMVLFLFIEYLCYFYKIHIRIQRSPIIIKYTVYSLFLISILLFGVYNRSQFIYFQF